MDLTAEPSLPVLAALIAIAFVGGVGISSVGPGGVLPTIGLFGLTTLDPAAVAGTAIVAHIATGIVGTGAYARSGHLRDPGVRRVAILLAAAAVVGTPLGILVNDRISATVFAWVLAAFAVGAAVTILRSERRRSDAMAGGRQPVGVAAARPRAVLLVGIGMVVAAASGIAGLGGPMLAVPILVTMRFVMVDALAVAQVQSIVIASVGTIGYAAAGAIDWRLAAIVGIPQAFGVVVGWKIARTVPHRILVGVLGAVLLGLAPYLVLTS